MATSYTLRVGNIGIGVNKLQGYLNIFQNRGIISNRVSQDGRFGNETENAIKQFQNYAGLSNDGIVGERTWDAMIQTLNRLNVNPNIPVVSRNFYLTLNDRGIDVYKMQEYLNEIAKSNTCLKPLSADGIFGSKTAQTVAQFQYLNNETSDGIVGVRTWDLIVSKYLDII